MWKFAVGSVIAASLLCLVNSPADADPACVVGRDTIWNNQVCRDCVGAHLVDPTFCTNPETTADKPR